MKTIRFKLVTTVLFLLLTLFAAGFASITAQQSFAASEAFSAQQSAPAADEWLIFSDADQILT